MELHSRVYYKYPDSTIMGQLEVLFTTHHGDEEKFIQTALLINPQADEITQELVDLIDSIEHDLTRKTLHYVNGFAVLYFTHG